MVLNYSRNLSEACNNIQVNSCLERDMKTLLKYQQTLWEVMDLLNDKFSPVLSKPFDLYNWLNYNNNDEVAYFLNETTANAFTYSDHKTPIKLRIWLGKNGFIISVEQSGPGFNAKQIDAKKLKQNEGAAFTFFRNCKNTIFFDDPERAKIVYLEYLF